MQSIDEAKDKIECLKAQNKRLKEENDFLREQFNLSRHRQFGVSSEQCSQQQALAFNEPEATLDELDLEPEVVHKADGEAASSIPKTNKPKRTPLPKNLPRETRVIDVSDDEKNCSCCNGVMHRFGEEVSEQLEYIPASVKVIETVRPKYACRTCEKNNIKTPIRIAAMPLSPIPKSISSPSLLSQIISQKYQFALPLYRQESVFAQFGIQLSRKTMSSWVIRSADCLKPIYEALKQALLAQSVIHADETPVQVIQDDKLKSYMWVYCTGSDSPNKKSETKNIVLYDYQASRAGTCPKYYLDSFRGYLQVDGYAGYNNTGAQLVGCWAHARRKFIEAQRAQPKGKTGRADRAISFIGKLYKIEKMIKDMPIEERYCYRQEQALPIINEFKIWLDQTVTQVLPKGAIGKAIAYTVGQWEKLIGYCDSGSLSIDNNRAERAIKPFVIGRKNWLFCNTASGANASAMHYSIIETAKANGIDARVYIEKLLEELPKRQPGDSLDDLLPWNVTA